jgi:hypothetical protein
MMHKTTTVFILTVLVMGLILVGMRSDLSAAEAIITITAPYAQNAPAGVDDPLWNQVKATGIPIQGRDKLPDQKGLVWTRAIYTDEQIFFWFKWKDPSRSIIKQSWKFDGEKWIHLPGNEDRLAMLFETTRIDKFASRGCAVTCHSPPDLHRDKWKFATKSAIEKGDLWHWKAARSDPYGYADDAWLTIAGNPTGSYRETGRTKDKGNGGDVKNETIDGTRPLYMQNPALKPSRPDFLLMEEAVRINDYSIFKAGDTVPYRLPIRPSGSRFDVKAVSRYADGGWTLMLTRKLDTGHEDDVIFNPMKRYSFAMAVFDNSGSDHSKATKALVLKFKR